MIPLLHMRDERPPTPVPPYRHNPQLTEIENLRAENAWLRHNCNLWRNAAFASALVGFLLLIFKLVPP